MEKYEVKGFCSSHHLALVIANHNRDNSDCSTVSLSSPFGSEICFRTRKSSVPIAGLPLLSTLRNKNFSNPEAILMSQSAVPRAARQGSQSVMEVAATGPGAGCSRRYALSAVRILKYPLSLAVIGQFTVAIATAKSDRAGNTVTVGLTSRTYMG